MTRIATPSSFAVKINHSMERTFLTSASFANRTMASFTGSSLVRARTQSCSDNPAFSSTTGLEASSAKRRTTLGNRLEKGASLSAVLSIKVICQFSPMRLRSSSVIRPAAQMRIFILSIVNVWAFWKAKRIHSDTRILFRNYSRNPDAPIALA